jgi:MFS family permease
VLAYEEFGESSRVAGAFFTALGAGSVAGGFAVMALLRRFEPVRIAAVGLVGLSLPLWTLAFVVPLPVVIAALFLSGLLGGIVNAPLIGVITTRTPEALRPKVMTAVITTALLAGPLGLLLAGPLLEVWGPHVVFALVAGGELLAALPFALVAFSSGVASSAAEPSA